MIFHLLSCNGLNWKQEELQWDELRRLKVTGSLVYLAFVLESPIASCEDTCDFCHHQGVTVARRAVVFKVTLLLADSLGNTEAGTAVGNSSRKVIHVGGVSESSQMLALSTPYHGIASISVVLVLLA